MAFKGDGSAAGLTRNSDPPWTNSQRGVSLGAWVKYDGSGTTGVGVIASTFNKNGTVGGAVRLFKNVSSYGGSANSDSVAPATGTTVASSVKSGVWQFVALQFFTNTLRHVHVSAPSDGDQYGFTRTTTSLGSHTAQTGVCVGHLDNVTPSDFLQSSFLVSHAMFFPFILNEDEIAALMRRGNPLNPNVCRRPAQYYPLLDDGHCAVTDLKLSAVGSPAWDYDSPQLRSPNKLRPFLIISNPPGGATGTLAASESGSDTAAFAGDVLVNGTLAAAESAADTAAFAGDVIVSGAFASSESGSDAAAFAGDVIVSGAFAAAESADTASFIGYGATPPVVGSLAATESVTDFASLSGAVLIRGSLSAAESDADTASFTWLALTTDPITVRLTDSSDSIRLADASDTIRVASSIIRIGA